MFSVRLHRRVVKFLHSLEARHREQCKAGIDGLAQNPFLHRPGCDIKKLSGARDAYRLRVGDFRFIYILDGDTVLIMEAFRREKGY